MWVRGLGSKSRSVVTYLLGLYFFPNLPQKGNCLFLGGCSQEARAGGDDARLRLLLGEPRGACGVGGRGHGGDRGEEEKLELHDGL